MHIFKNTNYNFLRWRWHAIALSWVLILAGAFAIWTKGIPLGVEFAGGTVVIAQFERPVSIEQVRTALDRTFRGGDVVVQSYGDPAQNQVKRFRVDYLDGDEAKSKTVDENGTIDIKASEGKKLVIKRALYGVLP